MVAGARSVVAADEAGDALDDHSEANVVELMSMGALLRTNNINEAYGLAVQNGGRVRPRQRRMSAPYGTSTGVSEIAGTQVRFLSRCSRVTVKARRLYSAIAAGSANSSSHGATANWRTPWLLTADLLHQFSKARHWAVATAVPEDSLQNVKLLGEGTYAKVYKAKYKAEDGSTQVVAVKRLRPEALISKADRDLFLAEGRLLQRLRHKNIVAFIGMGRVHASGKRAAGMFIVQEYVRGGTLNRMVHQQMLSHGTYSVADAVRWMVGVAAGLECLHAEGVIHRDLKLDNILLTGRDPHTAMAKITDLGLHTQFATPSSLRISAATATIPSIKQRRSSLLSPSELLPEDDVLTPRDSDPSGGSGIGVVGSRGGPFSSTWRPLGGSDGQANRQLSGRTGSLMYMAPEVFKCEQYSHKADIFSFGVMLHEVVTGFLTIYRLPNLSSRDDLETYASKVAGGHRQPIPAFVPKPLVELITNCWHQDPSKRPEASEIHEALKQVLATYGGKLARTSPPLTPARCGCCVIS